MSSRPTRQELRAYNLHSIKSKSAGITRTRSGRGFRYINANNEQIRDAETLDRIRALVIPPAWNDVWICDDPRGYVQATGRDERGRKQSIYHPDWRAHREAQKFESLVKIKRAVARVRKTGQAHLRQVGLPKTKVLAMLVRLLDLTLIRIGNERYVEENGSYGLTTLRNRHVRVEGRRITFRFKGKSAKEHEVEISDRTLANHLSRLKTMPGKLLFQYMADETVHPIRARDVNEYLKEFGSKDLTAKAFRTLGATSMAANLIKERKPATKKAIREIVSEVAESLGNTVSVCRKSYIDPSILEPAESAS